jgi:hypothetical protein
MRSNGLFYFLVVVTISSLLALPLRAEETAADHPDSSAEVSDIFYLCKKDKIVRWLRAYKLDTGKCQSLYSKEGYVQIVSSATYFSMCEGVMHSVQKNLEEGGFKCTPMSKYSIVELD